MLFSDLFESVYPYWEFISHKAAVPEKIKRPKLSLNARLSDSPKEPFSTHICKYALSPFAVTFAINIFTTHEQLFEDTMAHRYAFTRSHLLILGPNSIQSLLPVTPIFRGRILLESH